MTRGLVISAIGPWRLSISLVFGAILTLLVAWWIALDPWGLRPKGAYGTPMDFAATESTNDVEVTFMSRHAGRTFAFSQRETPEMWRNMLLYASSSSSTQWTEIGESDLPRWIGRLARAEAEHPANPVTLYLEGGFGWPAVAMTRRQARNFGTGYKAWTQAWRGSAAWPAPLNTTGAPVPLEPHAPGFALNTLVFGVPLYTVISIPAARRTIRRLTNRCAACGYGLEGLTSDTCPECGETTGAGTLSG